MEAGQIPGFAERSAQLVDELVLGGASEPGGRLADDPVVLFRRAPQARRR
jgi:hypothetical protein